MMHKNYINLVKLDKKYAKLFKKNWWFSKIWYIKYEQKLYVDSNSKYAILKPDNLTTEQYCYTQFFKSQSCDTMF